jgi:DNA polymerase-3 subunit beta
MTTATTTNAQITRTRGKDSPKPAPQRQVATDALTATVLQEDLKRGLAIVSHAAASKSTLPVLSHVLIASAGANRLKISATNLEIGIVVVVAAQVTGAGAITLPAKLLADVVGGLPNASIALEMDRRTQSVHLACGRFEATIKGIDAEEFPVIPTIAECAVNARFTPEALCSAIAQVAFAASTDDTRPILTGVRLRLRDALASFVAADSFRLAFRDITLDTPVIAAQEVVVPARALAVFGKVLADADGVVELLIDDSGNRLVVRTDEVELITRCIDGRYPDADKYLTLSGTWMLEIDRKELTRAVKLATCFATASANVVRLTSVPIDKDQGTLTISANATEVGNNTSEHTITLRGPGGQVALNVSFLADGIAAIATPTIAIHVTSAQQPVVLKGVGDETFTYVTMPMTVR